MSENIFIGSKNLSCEYSMGKKNGLHAFGYNSAGSEPIWMKSGKTRAICWGWLWQILGAIRAVVTVWDGADFFLR